MLKYKNCMKYEQKRKKITIKEKFFAKLKNWHLLGEGNFRM